MMADIVVDITPVPDAVRGQGVVERGAGSTAYLAEQQLPLSWTKEEVGGVTIVSVADARTGVFGSGPDPQAALADLRVATREHREVLEQQEHLSPALQRQLEQLQRRR